MKTTMQKTVRKKIAFEGIGLHTGKPVGVVLSPAPVNSGVVFARADLPGRPHIPAHYRNVSSTQMATTIGSGKSTLSTVEHLMAAVAFHGIDNLKIDVFGPEVPIMDGSSKTFYEMIASEGTVSQKAPRLECQILRRVEVQENGKFASAEPGSNLEILASIEFDHLAIGYQESMYIENLTPASSLVDARTFGFLKDVEGLKRLGLACGGSLENAVVLDDTRILNPEGLRYKNEFARHKLLDAVGDLKLAGIKLVGRFRFHRAGHDLHRKLLEEIFSSQQNYRIIGESDEVQGLDLGIASVVPAAAAAFG